MQCPKCGEKLYELAEYCDACGCDLKQERAAVTKETKAYSGGVIDDSFTYQSVNSFDTSQKRKKWDKKGIVISALLIVAMLVVFGLIGNFVYRSVYKTPYEKRVENLTVLMNGKITTYEECLEALFPEFICEDLDALMKAQCEDDELDYEETMRETNTAFNSALKSAMAETNDNYEYSVSFKKERKLGHEELKDVEDSYTTASQIMNTLTTTGEAYKADNKVKTYEAYMKLIDDFTNVEFEEGYELEVELTAEDSTNGEKTKQEMTFIVVKIKGEWMIDFMHYLDKLSALFQL